MNHSKRLRDREGTGAMGCIIFILLLIAILYASFQFSRPYVKRSLMKDKLGYVATWSLENPHYDNEFVIKSVLAAAKELSIDLNPEDIEVEKTKERVTISVYWEDEIKLPYYTKHLEFEIEVTRKAGEATKGTKE